MFVYPCVPYFHMSKCDQGTKGFSKTTFSNIIQIYKIQGLNQPTVLPVLQTPQCLCLDVF